MERQADPEDRRRLTLLLTRDGKRVLVAADAAAETRLDEIAAFLEEPPEALAAGSTAGTAPSTATARSDVRRDS